jgi:signal peptidase I
MVKRVVGLPGDTVELRDKKVWVNGLKLYEPYAWRADSTVYPANLAPRDNFGPVTVPERAWFVLGDNRDNSNDSRMTGCVAASSVIGRAYRIYWPLDRAGPPR